MRARRAAVVDRRTECRSERRRGAAGCKVGVSWNNFKEQRWATWDEPGIGRRSRARGGNHIEHRRRVLRRAAGDRRRAPHLAGRGGDHHPRPGRHGDPADRAGRRRSGHPGGRVRPADRERARLLPQLRQPRASASCMAEKIFQLVPKGNYAIIKGNRPTPTPTSCARGWRRSSVTAVAPGHQDRRRGLHRQLGCRPSRRPTMENCLTPGTTRSTRARRERQRGRRHHRRAQGTGSRWQGPRVGAGHYKGALNRVALGTQTRLGLQGPRGLGTAAGKVAVALCAGHPRSPTSRDAVHFKSPERK